MRKLIFSLTIIVFAAIPASAGMFDLAKTVLGGKSVLKKAESSCGTTASLTQKDNLTLDTAVSAVRKIVPNSDFLSLTNAANSAAETDAKNPAFCEETKKKKPGILGSVSKAGKKILMKKIGL